MEDLEKVPKKKNVWRHTQSEEDELLELTDEIYSNREPLDFSSYQVEVMKSTEPEWPIPDPDEVLREIINLAHSAMGGNKQVIAAQAALILRRVAELADYIPISLERVAHISLSELPRTQGEIEPNASDVKKIS